MDPHKDSSPAALVLVFDQMIRRLYEDDDCEDEFVDGMIPVDEVDCYKDDGTLDLDRFDEYLDYEEEGEETQRNILLTLMMYCVCELQHTQNYHVQQLQQTVDEMHTTETRRSKKTRIRRPKFCIDPTTGLLRAMTPKLSSWWGMYIQDPKPECAIWLKSFRSRFRLPYQSYLDLLELMDELGGDLFNRWKVTNSKGEPRKLGNKKVSPIELLLLGSLRFLGRGWTFDDLEESTFIHQEVHRVFFHRFIEFGATKLYPKFITVPESLEELKECEFAYRIAGFPGCIGSTDATHIPLEKVSFHTRQEHLGYKSSLTTRTYNLTVNHKRQILHSTTGHPGRWNDKTLVRFDHFMDELRHGIFNNSMTFELLSSSGEKVDMCGAYVIVDNGYLNWSTTVPPMKDSSYRSEIRFSQWLESLRKDVECTFGILKGRWRILKTGIRLHNTAAADNIWLTCCALHNMLLNVDGLSEGWKTGVQSHWELSSGQFDVNDIPHAIQKLINPNGTNTIALTNYDRTKFGYCSTEEEDDNDDNAVDEATDDECLDLMLKQPPNHQMIAVNSIPLRRFRMMLIENFNVRFHQQQLVWPKRLATRPRDVPNVVL